MRRNLGSVIERNVQYNVKDSEIIFNEKLELDSNFETTPLEVLSDSSRAC
jgi:hypothetical protein